MRNKQNRNGAAAAPVLALALTAALLAAGTLVLFAALYFCARSMGAGHYNAWSEALNSCRPPGG